MSASAPAEQTNLGKVSFLREWDRADKTMRARILTTFLSETSGKTFYELEREFSQVASLFLARITTWMRLTYKFNSSLCLQLKAIQIFLSASNQDQYLMEFLEDGGVLTFIDILNQGRKYKEFICESKGVSALAECLTIPYSYEIQEKACAVLDSLSQGNPKYLNYVYQELITLLLNISPKSQKMLLRTLRSLQSKMKTAHHSIVGPLLEMLKTLQLEVQDEAINLILELKNFDVRPHLLNELVSLLRPAAEEPKMMRKTRSLPEFVQQSATAKVIRLLAEDNEEISSDLLTLEVVQGLLSAMGNKEHIETQIQASLALEFFVRCYPVIQQPVKRLMGDTLFSAFLINPEMLYKTLSETQAECLLCNNIITNTGVDGEKGTHSISLEG